MAVKPNVQKYNVMTYIPFGPSKPADNAFQLKRVVELEVGTKARWVGSGIEVGTKTGEADVQFGVDTPSQGKAVMNTISDILRQHGYSSVQVIKNGRRPPVRRDMKATIWLGESPYYKEVMGALKTGRARLTPKGRIVWKKTKAK